MQAATKSPDISWVYSTTMQAVHTATMVEQMRVSSYSPFFNGNKPQIRSTRTYTPPITKGKYPSGPRVKWFVTVYENTIFEKNAVHKRTALSTSGIAIIVVKIPLLLRSGIRAMKNGIAGLKAYDNTE